ncbi:protein KRI1 homolog [Schistocerca piceifrons]|uniref:protein KRI1 homolog n=1 Tax=Schistocerca piceifrons TaxID=274613 RepID=UPI001F5E6B97|nr:protein KRI1 homolog [Schistocerca piceifrons]
MKELLCGSDSEPENILTVNKSYAERYNTWREKEELQKLKDRYGDDDDAEDSSSSSEEDDENAEQLTKEIEKSFFKTLSCLKKKDPRIYDPNINFFNNEVISSQLSSITTKKEKEEKPLFLRDYERKIITEKEGKLSDDEEDSSSESKKALRPESPTLVEEQKAIKESFKNALEDTDEDEDKGSWGGLFQQRKKTKEELEKEEEDYLEWLKGQREQLADKEAESDLKYLHVYWNDPKLDENEVFLRDYLLNKRFLDDEDDSYIPTYNEIVHDSDDLSGDESTLQQQEEFEHKYNFRFEEPDKEFIKRYPRTMENSLRRKDDRRKRKREEIRQRKEAEKAAKREEIKKLKALKRKEILEKIEKLKYVTGNNELGFKDEDIEGDFDPEEYDKRMNQLFSEEYYAEEGDSAKPEFPELDDELEIENWENLQSNGHQYAENEEADYEPHCEDPDFNMDCDYDPTAALQSELIEPSKKRKKRRRQSKFAEIVSKPKPSFNPNDQTFDEYLDEYYKLDCEDVIGDLPCRFKYRKVVPNSFGLTIDEILRADDKELNKWCSLKKAVQYRPEHVEKYDVVAYKKKAQNEKLKRKILRSLYADEPDEEELNNEPPKKKKKKSSFMNDQQTLEISSHGEHVTATLPAHQAGETSVTENNCKAVKESSSSHTEPQKIKEKKKRNKFIEQMSNKEMPKASVRNSHHKKNKNNRSKVNGNIKNNNNVTELSDARLKAYGINPKKFKNKMKYGNIKEV